MKDLIFVTGNLKKAVQLTRYLNFKVDHVKLDLPEEQVVTVAEVAAKKARSAYEMLKVPVLVEDTALSFTALNGLPGPFIKWFLDGIGNSGLTQLLAGFTDRGATAESCFALCDETGVHLFSGQRRGTIALSPRGVTEFGWDPIFIPEGETKTWAEMSSEEQRATSMRRLALEKLQIYLEEHYK